MFIHRYDLNMAVGWLREMSHTKGWSIYIRAGGWGGHCHDEDQHRDASRCRSTKIFFEDIGFFSVFFFFFFGAVLCETLTGELVPTK